MFAALVLLVSAGQHPPDIEVARDKDPIVCTKSREHMVGTRLNAKRTCMRKSEWDEMERHAKRELQSITDRRLDPGRAERK